MSEIEIPEAAYDAAEAAGDKTHDGHYPRSECCWPLGMRATVEAAAPLIVAAELRRKAAQYRAHGLDRITGNEVAHVLESRAAELDPPACPYTFSHTREWCGNPTCRES